MKIKVYLFDKSGLNEELNFTDDVGKKIKNNQLLWVNILERKKETLAHVLSVLKFENAPIKSILNDFERPVLEKFEKFYRFFIISINTDESGKIEKIPIDFIVSKNIIVTVFEKQADYFNEFKNLDKGETHIGGLDTESFVASLLDLHVVSYFRAVEVIERKADRLDNKILTRNLNDEEFINEMLDLRRIISRLLRLFLPQRDVFYALSRPDFMPVVESDSAKHFQMLNQHYENALSSIESSRDTVLGLFDLYATRAAHKMNNTVKKLTFFTIVFGLLGVIAGVFGMNFEAAFFKQPGGFWETILGMAILAGILVTVAKFKDWI